MDELGREVCRLQAELAATRTRHVQLEADLRRLSAALPWRVIKPPAPAAAATAFGAGTEQGGLP